jgi:lipopolysaccharide/colanic/teichoic acid biosynthesis glycosyltransferase
MGYMQGNVNKLSTMTSNERLTLVSSEDLRIAREPSLYERRFKRNLDVMVGLLILLVTLPISLGIAIVIRAGLGKHILYSQQRVGLDGAPFMIWKFRTMRPDRRQSGDMLPAGEDRRAAHKVLEDPRHTGLGRLLRKLSLDELPQLMNVIRGDMSLVGPRPELVGVARKRGYLYHIRHDVRPGMTGPYQVSDLRMNGDLRDGLELDEQYVNKLRFSSDLRYLVKTVGMMLSRSSGS